MGFVVKQPSRMQGQCFFLKLGGAGNNFHLGSKMSWEGFPRPNLTPPKFVGGCLPFRNDHDHFYTFYVVTILYCKYYDILYHGTRFLISNLEDIKDNPTTYVARQVFFIFDFDFSKVNFIVNCLIIKNAYIVKYTKYDT